MTVTLLSVESLLTAPGDGGFGDIREADFSRLTVKVWPQSSAGRHPEVSLHG